MFIRVILIQCYSGSSVFFCIFIFFVTFFVYVLCTDDAQTK